MDNNIDDNAVNSATDEISHEEGTVTPPKFHNKEYTVVNGYATGTACPSQFFLTFSNGCLGYARYRWGKLTIHISESSHQPSEQDAVSGEIIFSEQIGGEMDGVLSLQELKEATQHLIHYTF